MSVAFTREENLLRSARRDVARQALQSTGRPLEAHAVLASALEGFSPMPEMPEIAEAQALLERLDQRGDGAIPAKDPATEG
jgi:hypothetical protein